MTRQDTNHLTDRELLEQLRSRLLEALPPIGAVALPVAEKLAGFIDDDGQRRDLTDEECQEYRDVYGRAHGALSYILMEAREQPGGASELLGYVQDQISKITGATEDLDALYARYLHLQGYIPGPVDPEREWDYQEARKEALEVLGRTSTEGGDLDE